MPYHCPVCKMDVHGRDTHVHQPQGRTHPTRVHTLCGHNITIRYKPRQRTTTCAVCDAPAEPDNTRCRPCLNELEAALATNMQEAIP